MKKKNTKEKSTKGKTYKDIPLSAVGRPTKYRKYFADMMLNYFDVAPYEHKVFEGKKGAVKIVTEAVRLPTLERFATKLNVAVDTLSNWAMAKDPADPEGKTLLHPEFFHAYNRIKQMQKEILIANGLSGLYQSNFAIFVATNFTDMTNKQEIDNTIKADERITGFNYIVPTVKDETDSTTPGDSGNTADIIPDNQTA